MPLHLISVVALLVLLCVSSLFFAIKVIYPQSTPHGGNTAQ